MVESLRFRGQEGLPEVECLRISPLNPKTREWRQRNAMHQIPCLHSRVVSLMSMKNELRHSNSPQLRHSASERIKHPLCSCAIGAHFSSNRPCLRRVARTRSSGKAWTVFPLMPVMVSAATNALRMASSVACTVARKNGSILSLGTVSI